MAQLNSRGTMTRSRWDFFEHSNGVSTIWGDVASGPIGAYFANNSTGSSAVDVYTITWSATVTGIWAIGIFSPPLSFGALAPGESHILSLQPDTPTPPGVNGMFLTFGGAYQTFYRYSNTVGAAQFAPIMGSYFLTLPPGWAVSISGPGSSSPCELSMTCWYQYVTDNIAPAR